VFSFLDAVFLWGLPLAGIPVLIHLLHRRRRRVVRWGAMQFLREVEGRPRRMRCWDEVGLMLVRALALAVLVLALARPMVRSSWFGAPATRELIVVLDDSMSTARSMLAGGFGTVHEAIVRSAAGAIDSLAEGDRVRVLLSSAEPRWLTSHPVKIDGDSAAALKKKLRQIKPTRARGDLLRSVEQVLSAEPDPGVTERLVMVVTDGQACGWRIGAGRAWARIRQKTTAADPPTTLAVLDVTRTEGGGEAAIPPNLSVDSVTCSRRVTAPGLPVTFEAIVRNAGGTASPAVALHWDQAGRELAVTPLGVLPPGRSVTASISHAFAESGTYAVTCRIEPGDVLPLDDAERVVVEVVDSVPVLVLDGSRRSDPFGSQLDYLLAAMGGGAKAASDGSGGRFHPQVVSLAGEATIRPGPARVVVYLGDAELARGDLERLEAFVTRGGGLWLIPGPDGDVASFNANFCARGGGLSPVTLDPPVGSLHDPGACRRVHPPSEAHPATRLLADTSRLDIDRGRICRLFPFRTAGDRAELSVLLATDTGAPLAVEHVMGRGRVIVQAVPMNLSWSNLPLCQAFVVMVQEWLWYLAEPTYTRWNLQLHEGLRAVFEADRFGPAGRVKAEVAAPTGRTFPVNGWIEEGRLVWRAAPTFQPGPHTLTVTAADGRRELFPFQVCRDPVESDLTPLNHEQRAWLASVGGWRFMSGPPTWKRGITGEPSCAPLWWFLLAGVLGLWGIEVLLAAYTTKRRRIHVEPIRLEVAPRLDLLRAGAAVTRRRRTRVRAKGM